MTFYNYPDERAFRPGEKQKWQDACRARAEQTEGVEILPVMEEIVDELNQKGFVVLEGFSNIANLEALQAETEAQFDAGKNLWRGQNAPQSQLRKSDAFTAIEQPFINSTGLLDIIFESPWLAQIASEYMGYPASLSGCNLRKSFNNGVAETETQIYHSDPNSPRFLKMFFYLNDVDEDGGPFQYVSNSYKQKHDGWTSKYRWDDNEIHTIYGANQVFKLTGKVGDVLIADTNAFHRGTKPIARDRTMLTIDWTIHPEFFNPPVFRIRQNDVDAIMAKYDYVQPYHFDFLIKE